MAGQFLDRPLSSIVSVVETPRDGISREIGVEIPIEHVVDVIVDDVLAMVLTCTPSNIFELVTGRLFTEGFISCMDDVDEIVLDADGRIAHVSLNAGLSKFAALRVEQVNTCGAGTRNIARGRYGAAPLERVNTVPLNTEQVFCMARAFADDTPLHASTYGVHSCSLFRGCDCLYSFEDLGRHNAFDKAVGAALADGVDMAELAVFSSGRIPVDMITKAIRSRIPMLVTKATPTTHSVAIAHEYGLTLIGRARPDSYCVFSGGQAPHLT